MAKDNASASSSPTSTEASSPQQTAEPGSTKKSKSKVSKPRLTASQKNFNHKDAENKRRTAIRDRFTELSQMVPGAAGQERSEQVMLVKTSEFLREMLMEQRRLEELADERGVKCEGRLTEDDYGGERWKSPNMDAFEKDKKKEKKEQSGGGAGQMGDEDDD